MQSFKMIFSGVTILQEVEFPIFLLIVEWTLQQCSANNYAACDVTGTVFRKSYMSFRLVPKSVILNDLERRNGRYIALFH